jgi:hypothetical protein
MISNLDFDNHSIRKATAAFGALFNNIILVKRDSNGNELKRVKIPLAYGSKEKYLAILTEDPEKKRATQLPVPRMAYSLVGLSYDAGRKQQTMLKNKSAIAGNPLKLNTQFVPVPYDLMFDLNIITREISDGLEIIGKILPFFTPDYTVSIKYSDTIGQQATKDTPIILSNTTFEDNTVGPSGEVRLIIWTLSFIMKAYVFGPETSQSQIKKVQISFFNDGLTPTDITISGIPVTAISHRGSNTLYTSANVAGLVNANDSIIVDGTTIRVTGVSSNVLTSNLIFTTDAQQLSLQYNNPSTVMVARYTAEVTPNTALITDNYVITDLFEDFSNE